MLVGTGDKEDKASLSRAQTDCDKFYNHKWSLYKPKYQDQHMTGGEVTLSKYYTSF